jgi:ABC-type multidrug transport system fused ATPase/permease subunit
MVESCPSSTDFNLSCSFLLTWFTAVLHAGSRKQLEITDLPSLPDIYSSNHSMHSFQASFMSNNNNATRRRKAFIDDDWLTHLMSAEVKNKLGVHPLVRTITHCYGLQVIKMGLIKAILIGLSFSGPLLLGYIVQYLQNGVTTDNISEGLFYMGLLSLSSIASALLNTNYNLRSLGIKMNIQGALVRILFNRSMSLPMMALKDLYLTEAQIGNIIQVDVDQLSNCIKSIHDLWALPMQIIVACILLYINIQVAFIAGIVMIVLLIPMNSWIAKQIGSSTDSLMRAKDSRVKVITEALQSITSVKMCGLEDAVLLKSNEYRTKELYYLSMRKYLDSLCVFLWACTPVIVPFMTFTTTVLLHIDLTPSRVITTIALLNMLIFPMNALPWVINGFMEARVSTRRIAKVLSSRDGSYLHVLHNYHYHNYYYNEPSHGASKSNSHDVPPLSSSNSSSNSSNSSSRSSYIVHSASTTATTAGSQHQPAQQVAFSSITIAPRTWSWVQANALPACKDPQPDLLLASITTPLLQAIRDEVSLVSVVGGNDDDNDVEGNDDEDIESANGCHRSYKHHRHSFRSNKVFEVQLMKELSCQPGELWGIAGTTASGKTTLLLGILGEIRSVAVAGLLAARGTVTHTLTPIHPVICSDG